MFSKKGIVAIEYSLPENYITAEEFRDNNVFNYDKLTVGLCIKENGVLGKNESAIGLAKKAILKLLDSTGISKEDIGRLEVGTETNNDSAKAIKTSLMEILYPNTDVLGSDSVAACYGGTAAVLNSMAWLESPFCNKKFAIVICVDAFFYDSPDLYPLSSAGAVAILLGENPIFTFEYNIKSFSKDYNDFLKPKKNHPKTIIEGKRSIEVYMEALKECESHSKHDYYVYHTPYPKLILKIAELRNLKDIDCTLTAAIRNGNTYTASLYFALISLLSKSKIEIGKTISMFSFGSGCVASNFIIKKVRDGMCSFNIETDLNARKKISFCDYIKLVKSYFNESDGSIS